MRTYLSVLLLTTLTYLSVLLLTTLVVISAVSAINVSSDTGLRGGHKAPDAVNLLDVMHENKQTEYATVEEKSEEKRQDFKDVYCAPRGNLCLVYPYGGNCCSSRCIPLENSVRVGRCGARLLDNDDNVNT